MADIIVSGPDSQREELVSKFEETFSKLDVEGKFGRVLIIVLETTPAKNQSVKVENIVYDAGYDAGEAVVES